MSVPFEQLKRGDKFRFIDGAAIFTKQPPSPDSGLTAMNAICGYMKVHIPKDFMVIKVEDEDNGGQRGSQ